MDAEGLIEEAIQLAATAWQGATDLPGNLHLRDRTSLFARRFVPIALEKLPQLRSAGEQVLLLIIASGLERSGLAGRPRIERELGIILPDEPSVATET